MAGLLALTLFSLAQAQSRSTPPENIKLQKQEIAQGDPARWYQDDATAADQLRTLRKEIGAALQEANIACKKGPASERASCMKEARATYQQDMANAAQIRSDNHRQQ
jgi:hypothetical protein